MTRIEANRIILEKISNVVESHPDWRFHQILQNMNIVKLNGNVVVDQFFEESGKTLEDIHELTSINLESHSPEV